MGRIIGLDLGTTSIGWAVVDEDTENRERSAIIDAGVRVVPLTTDEKNNFEKGKTITTNADRTMARAARRNLQRFKLRREELKKRLISYGWIDNHTIIAEEGTGSTHSFLHLRAKAATEKITIEELSRVLFSLNKKRGYKSSRKSVSTDEGEAVDGIQLVLQLQEENKTPGQWCYEQLKKDKRNLPPFYRSDLIDELKQIWETQKLHHGEMLSDGLWSKLIEAKGAKNAWAICKEPWSLQGIKLKGNKLEQRKEQYKLRSEGVDKKLELEHLAIVISQIIGEISKASGYLGAISDRSKILITDNITVGQYLWRQIDHNPHQSLKNQVFYRQDYLAEFDKIWETQQPFFPEELTPERAKELRDIVIFYQRPLRSQKNLISRCPFEKRIVEVEINGKKTEKEVGPRVAPRSSPLFQESKIWQSIYNYKLVQKDTKKTIMVQEQPLEARQKLFARLSIVDKLKPAEVAKVLDLDKPSKWDSPQDALEGNTTNHRLYKIYQRIATEEGYGYDWDKRAVGDIQNELKAVFEQIGVSPALLDFDATLEGNDFDKQPSYQLWHLLYATQDDEKISKEDRFEYGNQNVSLQKALVRRFGFSKTYAKWLSSVVFLGDYGNLSAKALRRILPFLQKGEGYSDACAHAGYNHSNSITKEENAQRPLDDHMALIKKNELRNPVVEKILNQTAHVVNGLIDRYGKPDIIRIELARELKKGAKEREKMTKAITGSKKYNEKLVEELKNDFNISNPSRNDIVRLKLYKELAGNGFRDLYEGKKIKVEDLFTHNIEIEHILPKARFYDDSFANKTLAFSSFNKDKGADTPLDHFEKKSSADVEAYRRRVEVLFQKGDISKKKYNHLLMHGDEIPENFLDRDLRNTQYISKEAVKRLSKVVRNVQTTSGAITDRLREDWGIMETMKELNLPIYEANGLVDKITRGSGETERTITKIQDWTKRNDHRHHAMDAITVAFTRPAHIQYLNHLNAHYKAFWLKDKEDHKEKERITQLNKLRNSVMENYTDSHGRDRKRFISPFVHFRPTVKRVLEEILISYKAKNKVATIHYNHIKGNDNVAPQKCLTPRDALHKETVYAERKRTVVKQVKVAGSLTEEMIFKVTKPLYREALLARLEENGGDPKKAFTGKNSLKKNPIYCDKAQKIEIPEKVKISELESFFTVRKPINKELKLDKIVDQGAKKAIEEYIQTRDGKGTAALDNIVNDPIWMDKEKTMALKNVRIEAVKMATPLHTKRNHKGEEILDHRGRAIPTDYVQTRNNHHIAIYRDAEGKLYEKVVPFFEAVERVQQNIPIVQTELHDHPDWSLLFTLKQNEMFILPDDEFDPNEIDLMDPKNRSVIAKHLYLVQNVSSLYYVLTHHYETMDISKNNNLKGWRFHRKQNLKGLEQWVKVRINHLGEVVAIGEYR